MNEKHQYTDKDVETFKNTNCPLHLLSASNDFLKKHMEAINWQPPKEQKPIVIVSEKPKSQSEEDTVPRRPIVRHSYFTTSWTIINKLLGLIKCNNCKIHSNLKPNGNPPDVCPCCGMLTDKKKPFT